MDACKLTNLAPYRQSPPPSRPSKTLAFLMDTALFSPSNLFHGDDQEEEEAGESPSQSQSQDQLYVERTHAFPGMELTIREFSFHQLNANLLWPGTFAFCDWLVKNQSLLHGQRILELGSGTGALAIFLRRSFGVDITTSDFDDEEIEENIAHNCKANDMAVLPHIRHSWGDNFPTSGPDWDLIIASDILLCKKDQKADVTSSQARRAIMISGEEVQLCWPLFIMSWRRRIGGKEEALFFTGCQEAGLIVQHVGSRVYCINAGIHGKRAASNEST